MMIVLNGERHCVTEARSVAELIAELQLLPATLLIEHNGLALHRHEWISRAINDGDKVELIHVVAGG